VNFRIYGTRTPVEFEGLRSTDCILAAGPVSGVNIIVDVLKDRIQLNIDSILSVLHGVGFDVFAALMQDEVLAALGPDYFVIDAETRQPLRLTAPCSSCAWRRPWLPALQSTIVDPVDLVEHRPMSLAAVSVLAAACPQA
jgi:hypothetical protein